MAVGFNYPTFEDWVERDRSPAGRTAVVQFAEVRLPGPTNVRSLSVRCPDGTVLRGTHAATIAGAPHVASIHEGRKSIGP